MSEQRDEISQCKCGGKIALASADWFDVTYDREPFVSGKAEPPGGETFMLGEGISLLIHLCVECQQIRDASVEVTQD